MNGKIRMMLAAALLSSLFAAGCGGGSSPGLDADFTTDEPAGEEVEMQAEGEDVPMEEAAAPDETGEEPAAEEGTEIVPDQGEEPGEVVAAEETLETSDVPAEDAIEEELVSACSPLIGTADNLESWTVTWMGSGTHATFELTLSNPNTTGTDTCRFTGVIIASAKLKNAADDGDIISYAAIDPTGPATGIIDAGLSYIGDGAVDSSTDTSAFCGLSVYIELTVHYTIGGAAQTPVKIKSDTDTHGCVS